jgi:hypothetical protein
MFSQLIADLNIVMLTTEQISDLFINGFVQLTLPEINKYNYDEYKFCIAFDEGDAYAHTSDPKFEPIFEEFAKLIEDRYVRPLDASFTRLAYQMVQGVNLRARVWHTDVVYDYDMNLTFLIYLDDTSEFKNGFDIRNQVEEWNLLPKPGDMLMTMVNKKFQHKGNYNGGTRRVLLFDYFVPALGKVNESHD